MQRISFNIHLIYIDEIKTYINIMKPVILSFFLVILSYSLLSQQEGAKEPAQPPTASLNETKEINNADSAEIIPYSIFMATDLQNPMFVPRIEQ